MIVFYSWQSDLPDTTNKFFIKSCLTEAIAKLNKEITITDANRDEANNQVVLDHDTNGILGIPDVASTILSKIDACNVFLADVSFTGAGKHNRKLYPNSNVLYELGYAVGKLGSEKIILVMDSAHGKPDALPFDLQHKRHPIQFDSTAITLSKEKVDLIVVLKGVLRQYYDALEPEQTATVNLRLRLNYRKEDMQKEGGVPDIRARGFKLNVFATNTGKTTLRDYSLEMALPKPILQSNNPNQFGKRIDEQTDPMALFHFPGNNAKPLPDLTPGREILVATVWCHLSERTLPERSAVLESQIKATMYCHDMMPVSLSYPMSKLDPFRLIGIAYDSREFNVNYELESTE